MTKKSKVYTSNVFLVTGSWKGMEDINTLIDVGRDPSIFNKILEIPTGVGKKAVEQVILSHSHFDHTELLPDVKNLYNPKVYAWSKNVQGVDHLLKDGEYIKIGDVTFEVMYTPGHSNDSICLFNNEEGVLFSGDTPVIINSTDCTYEERFIKAMEKLCRRDVKIIYFGHGESKKSGCNMALRRSLDNIRKSMNLKVGKYHNSENGVPR